MSAVMNGSFARQLRALRLHRHADHKLFIVPLDHPISNGPVTGGRRVNALVGKLANSGVDAVVLHKGVLRFVDPAWFLKTGLIVHLSASTEQAPDPDAKYLVAGVEEALRLGADAVSVHVNLGSDREMQQISDLAAVGDACDRWNVPLMAMMYPRGPRISNSFEPALIAHAASIAADLGADIVKTVAPQPLDALWDITQTSPIPVLMAGGKARSGEAMTQFVTDALAAGAAGLAVGRTVFQADDPTAIAQQLTRLIHPQCDRMINSSRRLETTKIGAPA